MALNWSPAVIIFLVTVWPLVILTTYYIKLYVKTIRRFMIFVSISNLFALFYLIFDALAQLYASVLLSYLSIIAWPLVGICLMVGADLQSRDFVDTTKITMSVVAAAAVGFVMLEPGTIYLITLPSGDMATTYDDELKVAITIFTAIVMGFDLIWGVNTYRVIPKRGARYPRLLYLVSNLLLASFPVVFAFRLMLVVPGIMSILIGISSSLVLIAFAKEPKLGYFPPRALRLLVVETKGGISLFTHTWRAGEQFVGEDLFSGMVHGISLFLQESLNKGNMREIRLDEATLIIQPIKNTPVACVLVASRASQALREALRRFATRFYDEFSDAFGAFQNVDAFSPAAALIKECFPFIPDSDPIARI